MPRYFVNSTSQYQTIPGALISGYPVTLAAWARPLVIDGNVHAICQINASVSANNRNLVRIGLTASNFWAATSADATAEAVASSAEAVVPGKWYHVCGVFESATSRKIFVNGVLHATETTSRTPASQNRTNIGCHYAGAITQPFGGDIADVLFLPRAVPDSEVWLLCRNGPLESLRTGFWWKENTVAPERDVRSTNLMSNTGGHRLARSPAYQPVRKGTLYKFPLPSTGAVGIGLLESVLLKRRSLVG